MITLGQVEGRLVEIGDGPMFLHLKSDHGHHNWYRNVPIGREMLKTDAATILSRYPVVSLRVEPGDTRWA